ncbi:helix-turn-helix transcriptional regulator [Gluconobacter albidus]|uniref:helix-turn-helix transcriptional regulator n=1 Tax=Gluconobacter albidus TaxID=318683 RepID=UPI001B8C1E64|nr:YafY family protein [Gluconobacter albidus]MBS1029056.1 YafY family transcriptional regulator [Gluconobacter albidus]
MRSTDRLFQIIQILRRSSRPVTARMLGDELEVSIRTVYRDIAHLTGQRIPISGEAGVGYVLGTGYDMPPLALLPTELEAIVLGAQWVAAHGDTTLSRAALDVLSKVSAIIPKPMQSFISTPSTHAQPSLEALQDTADAASLRAAIRVGVKLRLCYRDQQGELTERIIWPVVLGYSDITRMLIAWCELRQGFRHFRTDRIHAVEILAEQIGEPRHRLLQRWKAARVSELAKFKNEAG